jgi:hypothetical protein
MVPIVSFGCPDAGTAPPYFLRLRRNSLCRRVQQFVVYFLFLSSLFRSCSGLCLSHHRHVEDWKQRWVESDAHRADGMRGRLGWDAGTYFGNWDIQVGMKTLDPKKFYHVTADIGKSINNRGKLLIISYTAKLEMNPNCTGAYLKILPDTTNQSSFNENDPYEIMFGPDLYSPTHRDLQLIMKFGNVTKRTKTMMRAPMDNFTHLYSLIIKPSNTFEVMIDRDVVLSGLLRDEFDCLGPRYV